MSQIHSTTLKLSKENVNNIQVSSVLRNDINYGKNSLLDDSEDTCWSSDKGRPQWLSLELYESVLLYGFNIQFQGGFVGENCTAEFKNSGDLDFYTQSFYPEDVNLVQTFQLSKPVTCNRIKFIFDGSTDFFGRVIVYSIHLLLK